MERLEQLHQESETLEKEWQVFETEKKAFEPLAQQLAAARKAKEIEPSFEKKSLLARQLETASNQLREAENRLPNAEVMLKDARNAETSATENRDAVKKRQEQEAHAIRKARKQDDEIARLSEEGVKLRHRIQQTENAANRQIKAIGKWDQELETLFQKTSFQNSEKLLEQQQKKTRELAAAWRFDDILTRQQKFMPNLLAIFAAM